MSTVSLSGLGYAGAQYDFASMTPKELLAADSELLQQGKITQQQSAVLQGFAVDSTPINRADAVSDDPLNSTTPQNYLQAIQWNIDELQNSGDAAEQTTLAADQGLLQILDSYQNAGSASYPTANSSLNLQA